MDKKTKSETLTENIVDKGKQVFLNKSDLVGDNPNIEFTFVQCSAREGIGEKHFSLS